MADQVKYMTYKLTKLDCKIPDVLLYSCTLGNKLMMVAIRQSIRLNVMKKM